MKRGIVEDILWQKRQLCGTTAIEVSNETFSALKQMPVFYQVDRRLDNFMGMKIVLRPDWEGLRCEVRLA